MRMEDPVPTFTYFVEELAKRNLSYLHVVEPRAVGDSDVNAKQGEVRIRLF
jgi:NADPH2 dehydrogenase